MKILRALALLPLLGGLAHGEILFQDQSGFALRHEVSTTLAPGEVWDRLLEPNTWWDPEHTYSGDAANLSLADEAGAYWREDWSGGSVLHGQILLMKTGEQLVLSAPFGPLMATGARCIWSITLTPDGQGGTTIQSTHRVVGAPGTGLEELAGPVDFVMGNGLRRLAG
jgi:hypothetical protein